MQSLGYTYLETLRSTLTTHKRMLELLENRIVLMRTEYSSKSDYEKNEVDILEIKTIGEIDILRRVISEKENYFVNFMKQFSVDFEDMQKNFSEVLLQANKRAEKDTGMALLLASVKWDSIEKEPEAKVQVYKRIKGLLSK